MQKTKKLLTTLTITLILFSMAFTFAFTFIPIASALSEINLGAPPIIDGTIDSAEWVEADTFILKDGKATAYVMNDNLYLYVAFDIADPTVEHASWPWAGYAVYVPGASEVTTVGFGPGSPAREWITEEVDPGTGLRESIIDQWYDADIDTNLIDYEYGIAGTGQHSTNPCTVETKVALSDLGISPGDDIKFLVSLLLQPGSVYYRNPVGADSGDMNDYMDFTISHGSGNVGDTVTVWGTSTTLGGLIEVYWDSVKTWDGEAGLLGEDYAVGTNYEIDITIPEAVAGNHYVIVKDVEAAESKYMIFTVLSKIELDPEIGIIGDTITVSGTGFAAYSEITLSGFDFTDIDTVPSTVTTSDLGSFTCEFDIPEASGATTPEPIVAGPYPITAL